MIVNNQNYIIVPRSVSPGLDACLVGTPARIFLLPLRSDDFESNIAVTESTYRFNGAPVLEGLQKYLTEQNPSRTELEARLEAWLIEIGADLSVHILDLDGLDDVRIKTGLLSRGLYYKKPGARGWTARPISGKEHAMAMQEYYANRL